LAGIREGGFEELSYGFLIDVKAQKPSMVTELKEKTKGEELGWMDRGRRSESPTTNIKGG
jgi:hypothetical protein